VSAVDPAFAALLSRHLPFLGDTGLTADADLRDLGLDSMGAVELILAVEERYDIEFTDDVLTDETFGTAGSLWRAIEAMRSAEPAA
jgi:acyl carrier protein